MKTKEFKIQVPEGYEIDKENSTFKYIKFRPIKKNITNITYEDICEKLFETEVYFIESHGDIVGTTNAIGQDCLDKNNASNKKQLEKLLALNQLLNIAEYYNRKSNIAKEIKYKIAYLEYKDKYDIHFHNIGDDIEYGISVLFNRTEDAQSVIDNPNFREILDTIYKN